MSMPIPISTTPCLARPSHTARISGELPRRACWTVPQALEIVGGDLVEVSPPYNPSGTTALLGVNPRFEMPCVLPGVKSSPSD
jgi:hypothetical protein